MPYPKGNQSVDRKLRVSVSIEFRLLAHEAACSLWQGLGISGEPSVRLQEELIQHRLVLTIPDIHRYVKAGLKEYGKTYFIENDDEWENAGGEEMCLDLVKKAYNL